MHFLYLVFHSTVKISDSIDSVSSNPDHHKTHYLDQEPPGESEVSFLLSICRPEDVEQGSVLNPSGPYDNGLLVNSSGSRHSSLSTQTTEDHSGAQYEFLNGCVAGFSAESSHHPLAFNNLNANNTFFNLANNQPVAMHFSETILNDPVPLYDGVVPGPSDTTNQYQNVLGCDFTLYSEEDNLEEQFGLQYPSEHLTGTTETPAESPCSSWSHEDALGSPLLSSSASRNSEDRGSLSPAAEDLNALAERRLKEDDGGKRRRKLSISTLAKRSRVQKAVPERKTGIRRPRKPSFFCRWEGCMASFTRQREFEMHMGKHEKPLFFCDVCQQLLTRKDNRRKHDDSKRHRANLANSPVLSSPPPSFSSSSSSSSPPSGPSGFHFSSNPSPTVSASSSLPCIEGTPLLLDQLSLYPHVGNQHTVTDFLPLNTEAKMLMLQAKIAALGEKHEALNFEIKEVMQEMETIRREA